MRWAAFVVVAAVVLPAALVPACTPAQQAAVLPGATKAACVLLHALADDGTTDSICATAEDLAPLVATLIANQTPVSSARKVSGPAGAPALVLEPVAELPAPARAIPRRRCVAWVGRTEGRDAAADRE